MQGFPFLVMHQDHTTWSKWMWAPIWVGRSLTNKGYGHSGKAMKGWVTCPFAMTTDLQVVLKYQLIPVAPCSHNSFWNIWPGGYFKMEC